MVKVRITGTKEEISRCLVLLTSTATVLSETEMIKNRNSMYYRKYIELEIEGEKTICVK